jgi:hypothetical protein
MVSKRAVSICYNNNKNIDKDKDNSILAFEYLEK